MLLKLCLKLRQGIDASTLNIVVKSSSLFRETGVTFLLRSQDISLSGYEISPFNRNLVIARCYKPRNPLELGDKFSCGPSNSSSSVHFVPEANKQ